MRRLAALACASSLLIPVSATAGTSQPVSEPQIPADPAQADSPPHAEPVPADPDPGKPAPVEPRAPASSPTPAPTLGPLPPPELGADQVRLHMVVEGPRGDTATVFRHTGTTHAWGPGGVATAESASVVCSNPCGTPVSKTAGTYYVNRAEDGPIMKSRPFGLGGRGSDVTVRVRPGNRAARVIGFTLTTMGAAFAILGPMILGIASTSDDKRKGMVIGGAFTGAGVGGLVIGIPLMVRGRNRVRLVDGRPGDGDR
jgi:hypothetical protein